MRLVVTYGKGDEGRNKSGGEEDANEPCRFQSPEVIGHRLLSSPLSALLLSLKSINLKNFIICIMFFLCLSFEYHNPFSFTHKEIKDHLYRVMSSRSLRLGYELRLI